MNTLYTLAILLPTMLVSLTLSIVALLTDNWYEVSTIAIVNSNDQRFYNFHYGLWRLCYDNMPIGNKITVLSNFLTVIIMIFNVTLICKK